MSKGAAVAYCVTGGLIAYSGIKGATISDTVKAVFAGNLNVSGTETVGTPGTGFSGSSAAGISSGGSTANYKNIAYYLSTHGYTQAAAAGIVGCVAGESSGNPEAVGDQGTSFGIIQEHGSQYAGLVTGNSTQDLDTQLSALLAYNSAQGAGLVSMLNSITDPVQCAYFYSEHFERPAVKDSDVVTSVATSVYQDLIGGKQ